MQGDSETKSVLAPSSVLVDSAITETLIPGSPWDTLALLLEKHIKVRRFFFPHLR